LTFSEKAGLMCPKSRSTVVITNSTSLGGAHFEIISTNKIPPVKILRTGRLASFLVLAAVSLAGTPAREGQKRRGNFNGINTGQAAHFSNAQGVGGELGGNIS